MQEQEKAARLYREYGPVVYRRCLRLLKDREEAKDATQEVFVKLIRDMKKLEDRETVLPWIYRVTTNHCLNTLRAGKRHGAVGGEEDAAALDIAQDAPQDLLPARQLSQAILSRFDQATQAVAVGVFVDGMEHEEVAAALGISRRTVARKLDRFLENARKYVTRSES